MIVLVSRDAWEDLEEADKYYTAISFLIANRLLQEFQSLVKHIEQFPRTGIPFRKKYRMFPMRYFPYTVICEIRKDRFDVVRLLHNIKHPRHRTKRRK